MAAYKYFYAAFASSGTIAAVPDTVQGDGTISYPQGWGPFYTLDLLTNPSALPISEPQTNQLFLDITSACQQYQQIGVPNFITTAQNLGTPYSYAQYSYAIYTDGRIYQSKVNANTSLPTTITNWRWMDGSAPAVILDNITFDSAVVQGNVVYFNQSDGKFYQALANGALSQNVIGVADVTNSRVYVSGDCTIMSGLTAGALYYLSASSPGGVTLTPPISNIVQAGVAKSATELFLAIIPVRNLQVFQAIASTTFKVPLGVTQGYVSGAAGGAGGGGSGGCQTGTTTNTSGASGGGGGDAGQTAYRVPITFVPGETLTITIGAGGSAGTAGAAGVNPGGDGGDGNNTILLRSGTPLLTLTGGNAVNTVDFQQGAPGGGLNSGSGGPSCSGAGFGGGRFGGDGGWGGSTPYGQGAGMISATVDSLTVASPANPGIAGSGYGSGGSGASGGTTQVSGNIAGAIGGPGAPGILIGEQ
jgi:hypothetical protein